MALRAHRLAAVAGQDYTILYGVALAFNPFEETVDARECAVAVPQQVTLLLCELIVWAMDREPERRSHVDEFTFPFAHAFAAPAHHGIVIHRQRLVGHHEVLVDAHHLAVALTHGAGSDGVVEVEHHVGGLFEGDSVGLEAL